MGGINKHVAGGAAWSLFSGLRAGFAALPLGSQFVAQQMSLPGSFPLVLSRYSPILNSSLYYLFCICVGALKRKKQQQKNLLFMLFIISKYQS